MDSHLTPQERYRPRRARDLPVILVSARSSDREKARGAKVGANDYIVKSAFDQKDLLETLAQLL
jgi:DNA-binding response OmpR family regulator